MPKWVLFIKARFSDEHMHCSKFLLEALLLTASTLAYAEHLPAIGPTYPIQEESALDLVKRKLAEKHRSGELKRLQDQAMQRSMNSLRHPMPVRDLGTVKQRARHWFDPSIVVPQDVLSPDGQLLAKAGTRINPLAILSLSKRLVFFDGRDPVQREGVRRLIHGSRVPVKPVLVGGSWMALTREWKMQVYYDQHGLLTQRFGIRAVPTVVSQQGGLLALDEIPGSELR